MRSGRKQRVIETIYVSGMDQIKVIYDVDAMLFKARVFEEWIKAPLLSDLRKKVGETIEGVISSRYEWIPIIEVEEQTDWGDGNVRCVVGFVADRYYIAKQKSGAWLRCDWTIDVTARSSACQSFKNETFEFPSSEREYDDRDFKTFYIPYSDEKWEGLKRLSDAIDDLKEKLRELIGTDEGQKRLSVAGKLMLEWREDNGKVDERRHKDKTKKTH